MRMIIVITGSQHLLNTYYWNLSSFHVLTHTTSTTMKVLLGALFQRWGNCPSHRAGKWQVGSWPGWSVSPHPDAGTSLSCWHAHTYNCLLDLISSVAFRPSNWACPRWNFVWTFVHTHSPSSSSCHPIPIKGTIAHPGALARTFSHSHIHLISC